MSATATRLRFPAGVKDGERLEVKGVGVPGEPAGDLHVRLHVDPPTKIPEFKPRFGAHAVRWMLLYSLFFALGVLAGISFSGIWELLAWIWSGIFGIMSTASAIVVAQRARDSTIARHYRDQFITLADLDKATRPLLVRAQDAITAVLDSDVYSDDRIDKTANRTILRQHEWDIAITLREISVLRAKVSQGRVSGPVSSALRKSYTDDQAQAQLSVTNRVEALEHYAVQIKIADDAYRDYQNALRLAELDEHHLRLRLQTAVEKQHMIPEITDLGEQAIVNRQSLLDTLIEANEAAGALALPRLGDPGEPIMAALLVERAEIHRAARRYDEAITDLTQVLELDPGRNDIRAVREKLLHEMRNNHE